jgi:hypothetical protein
MRNGRCRAAVSPTCVSGYPRSVFLMRRPGKPDRVSGLPEIGFLLMRKSGRPDLCLGRPEMGTTRSIPSLQLKVVPSRAVRVIGDAGAEGLLGARTIRIVCTAVRIGCIPFISIMSAVAGAGISCRCGQDNRCHDADRASRFRCETHRSAPRWLEWACGNCAVWIRRPTPLVVISTDT